jgi:hypothetical protein
MRGISIAFHMVWLAFGATGVWRADATTTNTVVFLETMASIAVKPWPGTGCDNPWTVCFSSSTNRRYTFYYATNLTFGVWTNIPSQTGVPGSGGMDTLTDPASTDIQRFYRLGVSLL